MTDQLVPLPVHHTPLGMCSIGDSQEGSTVLNLRMYAIIHAPTWLSTGTLSDSSRGAVARVPPERAGVRDTALQ